MSKFAIALNDQGRFSPTVIGEFIFQSKENLHVWKGKFATSMKEMAYQVNEAVQFMPTFADQFVTLRVVEIKDEEIYPTEPADPVQVGGRTTCPKCGEDYSMADIHTCAPPIKLRQLKLASK